MRGSTGARAGIAAFARTRQPNDTIWQMASHTRASAFLQPRLPRHAGLPSAMRLYVQDKEGTRGMRAASGHERGKGVVIIIRHITVAVDVFVTRVALSFAITPFAAVDAESAAMTPRARLPRFQPDAARRAAHMSPCHARVFLRVESRAFARYTQPRAQCVSRARCARCASIFSTRDTRIMKTDLPVIEGDTGQRLHQKGSQHRGGHTRCYRGAIRRCYALHARCCRA